MAIFVWNLSRRGDLKDCKLSEVLKAFIDISLAIDKTSTSMNVLILMTFNLKILIKEVCYSYTNKIRRL